MEPVVEPVMASSAAGASFVVWQGWGVTGSIAALLIILITILIWLLPFPDRSLKAQLANHQDRLDLKARLGVGAAFHGYQVAIRRLNVWFDDWFGPPWSAQSFERCLAMAFVYPISFYVLSLLANGVKTGKVTFLQLAIFVLTALAFVYILAISFRAAYRAAGYLWGIAGGDAELARIIAKVALGAFAVLIAFSMAFAAASAAQGSASGAGGMALATGIGFILAAAFAVLFAIAGAGIFVATLMVTATGAIIFAGQFAIMLLLFFVMLPLTNALMDWLSWAVTRYILGFVARAPSGFQGVVFVLALLIIDFAAAALFFLVLSFVLPNSIELVNILLHAAGGAPFEWRSFASRAVKAPWTEGLIVTGILLTSLVPTFTQLVIGLAGIFARFTPGSEIAAGRITEHPEVTPTEAEAACVDRAVRRSRLWYIPASAIVAAIMFGGYRFVTVQVTPPGKFLMEASHCATAWSQGECPWLR